MCLKYVDTTIGVYEEVRFDNELIPRSFINMVDSIKSCTPKAEQTPLCYIVTQWGFMGTNNENEKERNPLSGKTKKCYEVIVRLTRCDEDEEKQIKIDLDKFEIDLNKVHVHQACYPYVHLTYVTPVVSIGVVPASGPHVIKVLVREKTEESDAKYTIQAMYSLYVKK